MFLLKVNHENCFISKEQWTWIIENVKLKQQNRRRKLPFLLAATHTANIVNLAYL